MRIYRKISRDRHKGITLLELVIALIIVGASLPAIINVYGYLVKENFVKERGGFSSITELEEDMIYNSSMTKSISILNGGKGVRLQKFDNCTIDYIYNPREMRVVKNISGSECRNQRKIIVGNVDYFKSFDLGDQIYKIEIRLETMGKDKSFKHHFNISVLR